MKGRICVQNQLHAIEWKEKTGKLDDLLGYADLSVQTINQGNEAEVHLIDILPFFVLCIY